MWRSERSDISQRVHVPIYQILRPQRTHKGKVYHVRVHGRSGSWNRWTRGHIPAFWWNGRLWLQKPIPKPQKHQNAGHVGSAEGSIIMIWGSHFIVRSLDPYKGHGLTSEPCRKETRRPHRLHRHTKTSALDPIGPSTYIVHTWELPKIRGPNVDTTSRARIMRTLTPNLEKRPYRLKRRTWTLLSGLGTYHIATWTLGVICDPATRFLRGVPPVPFLFCFASDGSLTPCCSCALLGRG